MNLPGLSSVNLDRALGESVGRAAGEAAQAPMRFQLARRGRAACPPDFCGLGTGASV